jgi:heptosyltransferase-3
MGDLVLTFGLLRRLREELPKTHITLICQEAWAPWMATCPWVDRLVSVPMSSSPGLRLRSRADALRGFMAEVWPLDFEMVVNPGTLFDYVPSRALSWFSGTPARVCWEDPSSDIDTGGSLNTTVLPLPHHLHETEKCRLMLGALGLDANGALPSVWWNPVDRDRGRSIALRARKRRRYLVALGVGSSEKVKRWPATRFLDVVRELRKSGDVSFVAMGGTDVAAECSWLEQQDSSVTACASSDVSIGAAWAAVAECDLYVGNDTGLMHLAAAAGIPVVAIIGIPPGAPPGTRGDTQSGPVGTSTVIVRPAPRGDFTLDVSTVEAAPVVSASISVLAGSQ